MNVFLTNIYQVKLKSIRSSVECLKVLVYNIYDSIIKKLERRVELVALPFFASGGDSNIK